MSDFEQPDVATRLMAQERELTNLAARRLLALGSFYFPTMQELKAAEEEKKSTTAPVEPLDNRGNA